jgi:hypothetical protein
MTKHLDRLAARVAQDPFFLAAVLQGFADSEQLDDAALAARIGCDRPTLTHLRLCRNPDLDPACFWTDVEKIAGRFKLDPDKLAEIVRLGQAVCKLRSAGSALVEGKGSLMAARDKEERDPRRKTEESP